MATFTAIQNKKQTAGALFGVLDYATQEKKTRWEDTRLVSGHNCVPQSSFIEMQTTKERFSKTGGKQFYHFVQSFSAEDDLTPQEVNAIGLEFVQRQFPASPNLDRQQAAPPKGTEENGHETEVRRRRT